MTLMQILILFDTQQGHKVLSYIEQLAKLEVHDIDFNLKKYFISQKKYLH